MSVSDALDSLDKRIRKAEFWIQDHQKKSIRHTIYFGAVVAYVIFDIFYKILS